MLERRLVSLIINIDNNAADRLAIFSHSAIDRCLGRPRAGMQKVFELVAFDLIKGILVL